MIAAPKMCERGNALLLALLTTMMVAGMIAAGSANINADRQLMNLEFRADAQARSLAEAGIVDAFAWLRRQVVQPVTAFAPQRDLGASPPINETDDPSRGLVREFEVSPGLWGRYEVVRGTPAETFTDDNLNGAWDPPESFLDEDGNGVWSPATGTRDVTRERGLPGSGVVWFVESRGTLFSRPRADRPLGEAPNSRLAQVTVATEARRLTIAPPADATICADELRDVTIGQRSRIRGEATGIAGAENTGSPSIQSGSEVLTKTSSAGLPHYRGHYEDVYGVDLVQLKSMSDISTSHGIDGIPVPLPDYSLVVIEGDVTFTAETPLRGSAVVVVHGNATIESGSNSFFSGVLHVAGDLKIRAPVYMRGTILANGKVEMAGTGGDFVEIEHDPDGISRLLRVMGQYRLSKTTYLPGRVTADGRPVETLGVDAPRVGYTPAVSAPTLADLDDVVALLGDWRVDHDGTKQAEWAKKAQDKVEDAIHELNKGHADHADHDLEDAVEKLQEGTDKGEIPPTDAQEVIDAIEAIRSDIPDDD